MCSVRVCAYERAQTTSCRVIARRLADRGKSADAYFSVEWTGTDVIMLIDIMPPHIDRRNKIIVIAADEGAWMG